MILDHLFIRQIKVTTQVSPHTVDMVGRIPCSVSLGICKLDIGILLVENTLGCFHIQGTYLQ